MIEFKLTGVVSHPGTVRMPDAAGFVIDGWINSNFLEEHLFAIGETLAYLAIAQRDQDHPDVVAMRRHMVTLALLYFDLRKFTDTDPVPEDY